MGDLRIKLKSKYKNFISDGLKIYYSKNRPIIEILSFLENKDNAFIDEDNERILLNYTPINKEECYKLELKEFDFNFMDFNNEGFIIVDYEVLFDLCSINLLELLKPYNATIKQITPLFKNCLVVKDYLNKANEIIKEYFNNGVEQ